MKIKINTIVIDNKTGDEFKVINIDEEMGLITLSPLTGFIRRVMQIEDFKNSFCLTSL
jgi:hypothetical protein